MTARVVVLGAGPAGLMAALAAARAGARPRVLAKGWGVLHWHAGCVDVLARHPVTGEPVDSPAAAIAELAASAPGHPYAVAGVEGVAEAVAALRAVTEAAGYPLSGDLDRNRLLLTGVGGARRTCLVPATMAAGDLTRTDPALIVGFDHFLDMAPKLVADNLEQRGVPARGVTLDLPILRQRRFNNGPMLAALFETEAFRAEVAQALAPKVGRATRVGFPAVLGAEHAAAVVADLSARLGAEVFEIPIVPPSVPGIRLHHILTAAVRTAGGRVFDGMEATGAEVAGDRIAAVLTDAAAGRPHRTRGDSFVLATGGILGGGIVAEYEGHLREVVFGLPVEGPTDRAQWLSREFTDPAGHPVFRSGVAVDADLRPRGGPAVSNLFVAGGILAGADTVREGAVEGIALATGWRAGHLAAGHHSAEAVAS